jgi:small subunit ribosomal protein S7e
VRCVLNQRQLTWDALVRLTRELEKKFSDRHVVFVAQRRMLRKPTRTSRVKQKRPRSRTLTNVHERILEDLVYPTEIVGKRTRVAADGSKLLKVYADLLNIFRAE